MLIIRLSQITGYMHGIDLPVTDEQMAIFEGGNVPIQDAFPHLNAPQREYIKSGITPEEWFVHIGHWMREE